MRLKLEEYGIDPQDFINAIALELNSTSDIPVESKAPLITLGKLVSGIYNVKSNPPITFINTGSWNVEEYLSKQSAEVLAHGMSAGNILPHMVLVSLYYKGNPAYVGCPQTPFACIEDAESYKLLEDKKKLSELFSCRYPINPGFKASVRKIMEIQHSYSVINNDPTKGAGSEFFNSGSGCSEPKASPGQTLSCSR